MGVDQARVAQVLVTPHALEQLVARQDGPGVIGELAEEAPGPRSPIWDPDDDRRIYHRDGIVPIDLGLTLPSEAEGWSAWLRNPGEAALVGAPGSGLAACSGGE